MAAAAALALQPVALLVLILSHGTPSLVVFVALFGSGYGAMALVRPALVATLYGRARYASIAGVLAFAVTLAQAVVPAAAGKAYDLLGSYQPILWPFALMSVLAALALLPLSRVWPRHSAGL